MMEEKKYPTAEMLLAREKLNKIPKEERLKRLKESLMKNRNLFGETIDIQLKKKEYI